MASADQEGCVVVLTTMPDEVSAGDFAQRLVEQRVIACANIVPRITSVYRWDV
ncbi:MAG TPA: divalent-cation tolerance protein CutA, partial [Gemmatimonadetes bacterium]|nr:divalent-cation tolerance protein CutA [Gemmatimonadota bacterium]